MAKTIRYGFEWPNDKDDLEIELYFIREGGTVTIKGKTYGQGLFQHYRNAQSLLWPEDDHHRWSDLILKRALENDILTIMGAGDSSKTFTLSKFALVDWWAYPQDTLWLITSTEYRGSELRIWGALKELYNRAIDNFPWLEGRVLEGMHAITSDKIDDDQRRARSLRRGLCFVPCKKGSEAVSMSAFVGAKAKRLRHIGDESQFLSGVLSAYSNWFGKENFKGFICGNPLTLDDGLCTAAEPVDGGWDNWKDNNATQEWRSKFFNSWVIALDGRDSPNFDYSYENGPRFHYLVGKKKLDGVAKTHGTDSWHWFNQCVGKPKPGMTINRVITKEFCRQHGAHDIAFWQGTQRTLIYGLDPAYGGGDRCVGGAIEFGEGLEGKQILRVHLPEIIPINVNLTMQPEDQIANHVKRRLDELHIPIENSFYDSFGKGTLGFSFAQVFGHKTPRPVDFGQKPTTRPVRHDLFVEENGQRRLKRCDEEYSKFVTELWFSVREVIMGNQMRELPHDVAAEGCSREYYTVRGNLTEVEPKEDMKERLQHSPDLFDWLAVCVEGARQKGFKIETIGREVDIKSGDREDWLAKEAASYRRDLKKNLPTYA
jgi:hypothetical protein